MPTLSDLADVDGIPTIWDRVTSVILTDHNKLIPPLHAKIGNVSVKSSALRIAHLRTTVARSGNH